MKRRKRISIAISAAASILLLACYPGGAGASENINPAPVKSNNVTAFANVEAQAREAKIYAAIKKTYKFGERSESVKDLQLLLWNVKADGYYGSKTRNAHIYALSTRDMSIKHVPAVVYKKSTGPRFPSDKTLRCPKWEAKFKEYGLPVEVFSYIAYRESKCNPKAVNARWNSKGQLTYTLNNNGTWDSGLVQINSSWVRVVRDLCGDKGESMRVDLQSLLDVDCNLRVAKWIMENSSGKLRNWSIYGG
jgi:hypothetical protein